MCQIQIWYPVKYRQPTLSDKGRKPIHTTQVLTKTVACNLLTTWVVLCKSSTQHIYDNQIPSPVSGKAVSGTSLPTIPNFRYGLVWVWRFKFRGQFLAKICKWDENLMTSTRIISHQFDVNTGIFYTGII
jgi:hypothetical protein